MHHLYFPSCPVDGPIEPPVPYSHMGMSGAIPNKCGDCQYSFEGGCTRFFEALQRYMHLDYGPCGIDGATDPVIYEDNFIRSKVEIPRKCWSCGFLFHDGNYGFTCRKDAEKWGGCFRGLDWGSWRPDRPYFNLQHPKVTTRALSEAAHANDMIAFVKEYRSVNPDVSLQETRDDFARIRDLIVAFPKREPAS